MSKSLGPVPAGVGTEGIGKSLGPVPAGVGTEGINTEHIMTNFTEQSQRNGSNDHGPVLIIGGLGKTGGRVDALLRSQGVTTRPVSRSTAPAFDWARRETWEQALSGARAAYIAYQPDLAVEGAVEDIGRFSRLARDQGLERLVLLSGRGEPGAQRAEQALAASGLDWAVVRAAWFAQNFSESFMAQGIPSGEIVLPVGSVREPFVDADDIAEVAAAVLTGAAPGGRVYELTGPRALSFDEAAAELAAATGRPVRLRRVGQDAFDAGLRAAGAPEALVGLLRMLFTEVLDGRNEGLAAGVEQALGRPARDFADYARAAAAAGAWDVAA